MNESISRSPVLGPVLIPIAGILCLFPFVSSGVALLLGVVLALAVGNPYLGGIRRLTPRLLTGSVMGLGAGMDLGVVGRVGVQGFGYTILGISFTLLMGTLVLGRVLRTDRNTSLLVSVGTAICGGSAIAAVAPVIRAKHQEVSVALATVFILNAASLFIFPWLGHLLGLTESQFGLWSALAIHDTSSVVGACLQYGRQALEVGTTVKLARALWIIPVALLIGMIRAREPSAGDAQKAKRPWFILGFVLAAALVTWVPALRPLGHQVAALAQRALVVTLFLIGSAITREALRTVGYRPMLQGLLLWILVGVGSLSGILIGWIRI